MFNYIRSDIVRLKRVYGICSAVQLPKLLFVLEAWAVIYFRFEDYVGHRNRAIFLPLRIISLLLKPIVQGMTGSRICYGAVIGEGLLLHYSPGIVIASGTVIGKNATIMTGACIVYKANNRGERPPVIGDGVVIGTGSRIIGPVKIGNNVIVGASAVVVNDVPDGVTVAGVPAKIVRAHGC